MLSFAAFNRTVLVLASMLLMAALWGLGHIPGANLLLIVFTFLSSAFLVDIKPFRKRLLLTVAMTCYASAAQFLLSVSENMPFLQIIISALLPYFVFLTLPDYRAGCIVMITAYLAFSAPGGFLPAAERSADIFYSILIILVLTTLGNGGSADKKSAFRFQKYSPHQALIMAAELGIAAWLFKVLNLRNGAWIMLTILFISMSETPHSPAKRLALQRIFAVPLGIITGGFLLESFYRMDYRFVYLIPFIGAGGFFIFYNYGDFFLFSIIFMITQTLLSDWMTGACCRFNLWDSFFSRSTATLLGALLELFLYSYRQTGEKETT